jgi:hypothetical protein
VVLLEDDVDEDWGVEDEEVVSGSVTRSMEARMEETIRRLSTPLRSCLKGVRAFLSVCNN